MSKDSLAKRARRVVRLTVVRRRPGAFVNELEAERDAQEPSFAQRLPEDIVCRIFYALEAVDPPLYRGLADPLEGTLVPHWEDWDGTVHPNWCGPRDANWHDKQIFALRRSLHAENSLGWIALTHVCGIYRRVGLYLCAPLWGRVVCVFPKALNVILERARNAPLSFNFAAMRYLTSDDRERYAALLRTQLIRIDVLRTRTWPHLSSTGTDSQSIIPDDELWSYIHKCRLPAIRFLEITVPAHIASPSDSFGLHMSRMVQLVLISAPSIRLSAPLLQTLVLKHPRPSLNLTDLLNLLASTPRLEELEIISSLVAGPAVPESLPLVELPCLSAARWRLDIKNARVLWQHMQVPLSSMVHIDVSAQGQQFDDVAGSLLLDVLGERLTDPAVNAMTFVYSPSGYAVALASFAGDPASASPTTRTCIIMNSQQLIRYFGSIPGLLSHIFDRARPTNLRFFHASPCPPLMFLGAGRFDVRELYLQMRRLALLEVLSVSWIMGRSQIFLEALDVVTDHGVALPVLFAHIKTIIIRSADVADRRGVLYHVAERRWKMITGVLGRRTERGCAAPLLVLRGIKNENFEALEATSMSTDMCRFLSGIADERVSLVERHN